MLYKTHGSIFKCLRNEEGTTMQGKENKKDGVVVKSSQSRVAEANNMA